MENNNHANTYKKVSHDHGEKPSGSLEILIKFLFLGTYFDEPLLGLLSDQLQFQSVCFRPTECEQLSKDFL